MRRIRRFAAQLVRHWQSATRATRAAGSGWYRKAGKVTRAIARECGVSNATAAGVIAALSPRVQWVYNVKAARLLLSGVTPACFRQSLAKANRIAAGERPLKVLSGPKVRAFYRALMGDQSAAVVDVWTARAAGLSGDFLSAREYSDVAAALQIGATECNTTVSTLQAVAWVQVRGRAS